ncbi:MAG: right-handed parallel beta-helix repeat-containing protein [Bdellovibrionales bacterium]|nr:right-handed parallel beta-helix repeat-containing protein [Bdellovibrionales bacterium]
MKAQNRKITIIALSTFLVLNAVVGIYIQFKYRTKALVANSFSKTEMIPSEPWYAPISTKLDEYQYLVREPDSYKLEFSDKNIIKVNNIVEKLIKQGRMADGDRDWVPAHFVNGDDVYEVKARLRGGLSVHWANDYKSWRIRFPSNNLFHGMREINFIVVHDRGYYMEILGFHIARSLGLLTFRDSFANLSVNLTGKKYLYYLVESPNKEFLESNNKAASAIFRIRDQSISARYKTNGMLGSSFTPEVYNNYVGKTDRTPFYVTALSKLLEADTAKEAILMSKVDKFAAAEAIVTFAGTHHGLAATNRYLYYDDTVGKFEPILFDINVDKIGENIEKGIELGPRYAFGKGYLPHFQLLKDPMYRFARNKYLWELVKDDGALILGIYDQLRKHFDKNFLTSDVIGKNFTKNVNGIRDSLKHNISLIKKELIFAKAFVLAKTLNVADKSAVHSVRVRASAHVPIQWTEMSIDGSYANPGESLKVYRDSNNNRKLDSSDESIGSFVFQSDVERLVFRPDEDVLIHPGRNEEGNAMAREELFFVSGASVKSKKLKFHYTFTNAVTNAVIDQDDLWSSIENVSRTDEMAARTRTRNEFLKSNPEFVKDGKGVMLKKGTYIFDQNVVVPEGVPVKINAGVTIKIAANKSFISYSPVQALGTEKEIIHVTSKSDGNFMVFAVVGPLKAKTILRHMLFENYSEGAFANSFFTGGVSVFSAPVDLEYSVFTGGDSEDGFNAKNSKGVISNCTFSGHKSDAVDLDFGDFLVENSKFIKNRGDGFDVSGSNIILRNNIHMDNVDKGVSVGENSRVIIFNSYFANNGIGVAVKDRSDARVYSSSFVDNAVAYASYQKKPIFSGGTGNINSSVLWGNGKQVSLDNDSKVHFQHNLLQDIETAPSENFSFSPLFYTDNGIKFLKSSDSKYNLSEKEVALINKELGDIGTLKVGSPLGYLGAYL